MFLSDKLEISTEREFTEEGFLKVPAKISRIGVQEYLAFEMGLTDREPTEIIKVFRPQEEVFKPESLKSFANKPVTNNHPDDLINADNARDFMVGMSGPEVLKDGAFATTVLTLVDSKAIKDIEGGKTELSNGYLTDIDWTEGVTENGEHFDAIQRNIRGNHIALVEKGRAGPDCRVADKSFKPKETLNMGKVTIEGIDFEVSDQAAQAITKLQSRLTDSEKEIQTKDKTITADKTKLEDERKEAQKTADATKAKLDDAESKIPTTEQLDKLVADRTILIDNIRKISPDTDWKGKDAITLKKEVIASNCPNVQMDSVSDDYVSARFDMLLENISDNPQKALDQALVRQITKDGKTEDTRPAYVIAREKMMADGRDAWKRKGEVN